MAYLFGWREEDLGAVTGGSFINEDELREFCPDGGFNIASTSVIERVFIGATSPDAKKFGIYDFDTKALLGETVETTASSDAYVNMVAPIEVAAGTNIAITALSNGFAQAKEEGTNFRFFSRAGRTYENGFPDPYVGASSGNAPRLVLWADGYVGTLAPTYTLTAPTTVTPDTATSLTITGVASGTTASSLTLDDGTTTVTQTIDSQSHDGTETLTVNFTPVQGNIKFQSGLTLEATLSDASTVSGTTELVTIAGNAAVNVSNPVTTENSVYHEATSPNADTPETGDQIEHTDAANTTVAADGTITQTEVRDFEARFWSVTDRTWGSFETISPFDVDAVVGGLTRRNITRRALTRRAMTSRGMTS